MQYAPTIQGTNFLLGTLPYDRKEMFSFISFNNSQIEKYGAGAKVRIFCSIFVTLPLH